MFKKYKKIIIYSLIGLLILFFFSLLGLFIYFKEAIFTEVGESLGNLFQKKEVVFQLNPNFSGITDDEKLADTLNQVSESIVNFEQADSGNNKLGVGVIVSSDGLIITSSSVIKDKSEILTVLNNGKKYQTERVLEDKNLNLTLLKISVPNLKSIKFGASDKIRVGQKILALGTLNGLEASSGIVESVKDLIQTDANISSQDSGGPMININGELIGINLYKDSTNKNGYAIPISKVNLLLDRYKSRAEISQVAGSKTEKGYLGVGFYFKDLKQYLDNGQPIGPILDGVVPNSPADKSGLKIGDIIVSIDGNEFSDETELTNFIRSCDEGKKISIKVYRKNQIVDLNAFCGSKN